MATQTLDQLRQHEWEKMYLKSASLSDIDLVSDLLEYMGVSLLVNPEFSSNNHWEVLKDGEILGEVIFNFYLKSYRFISYKKVCTILPVMEDLLSAINN